MPSCNEVSSLGFGQMSIPPAWRDEDLAVFLPGLLGPDFFGLLKHFSDCRKSPPNNFLQRCCLEEVSSYVTLCTMQHLHNQHRCAYHATIRKYGTRLICTISHTTYGMP